jgi:exopolyphosphatase/guanosine-5'-triphosphate,3'-diphosphate pyrophosphatase
MANLVRYHRKRPPRRKDPELADLDDRTQEKIILLAAFMRLAETLDRSHANLVNSVGLRKNGREIVLDVVAEADVSLEIWGVEGDCKAFKRAFDRDLKVEVKGPATVMP